MGRFAPIPVLIVASICSLGSCGKSDLDVAGSPADANKKHVEHEGGELISILSKPEDLKALLPPGNMAVTILGYHLTPRTEELSMRWREALTEHSEWFLEYIEDNAGEEVLPYHSKFGLSEIEYAEMLRGIEDMQIVPIEESNLMILHRESGRIGFEGTGQLSPMNDIEIHTRTGTIVTPFGGVMKDIQVSESKNSPMGPFKGLRWTRSERSVASESSASAKILFARIVDSNRAFIDYRAKEIRAGQPFARADVLIEFSLSPPRK